ncbi:McrB family protein [Bifidobacterium oedipodis]|uniref:Endonuclease n=1 Tax=Bifidobacterium oedipodis TaxID=2675322 RepID=A0A7Y0HTS5_9BIFI|nr:AAA family ATPase [Bifidobacterium sp. DSM 109957]NMM94893.1 endonuclease [Bifidobacterium sp. DSM 109957]
MSLTLPEYLGLNEEDEKKIFIRLVLTDGWEHYNTADLRLDYFLPSFDIPNYPSTTFHFGGKKGRYENGDVFLLFARMPSDVDSYLFVDCHQWKDDNGHFGWLDSQHSISIEDFVRANRCRLVLHVSKNTLIKSELVNHGAQPNNRQMIFFLEELSADPDSFISLQCIPQPFNDVNQRKMNFKAYVNAEDGAGKADSTASSYASVLNETLGKVGYGDKAESVADVMGIDPRTTFLDLIDHNDIRKILNSFGASTNVRRSKNGSDHNALWSALRHYEDFLKGRNVGESAEDGTSIDMETPNDNTLQADGFEPSTALNDELGDFTDDTIPERTIIAETSRRLLQYKNVILHGVPGTGKTFLARQIAASIIGIDENELDTSKQFGFVQFHPNYDYSDFIEGLRPATDSDGRAQFELKPGIFKSFVDFAKQYEERNVTFVFLIDEINRGDIARILGELFYAIDPGYRGPKGSIETQFANMHTDENAKIYVPKNVFVLATMNDLDRSIDTFDFATRRRFSFVEIDPNSSQSMLGDGSSERAQETVNVMNRLNEAIQRVGIGLGKQYQLGAAYFKPYVDDPGLKFEPFWERDIRPLLEEYLYGSDDIDEKLKQLHDASVGSVEA